MTVPEASRDSAGPETETGQPAGKAPAAESPSGRPATQDAEKGPIGLALSGGGIRSATFSLGVLQALAAKNRLASFDYLSTVSGGGYIGSWLSAWIKRAGLREVQTRLKPAAPAAGTSLASNEPAEITWLRRYSNYLTPRIGPFSLDSLTLIATWIRNVGLNLVVLLSCLAVIFIAPLLLHEPLEQAATSTRKFGFAAAWFGLLFLLAVGFNLWHQGLPIDRRNNWLVTAPGVAVTALATGLVAACTGAVWLLLGQPAPKAGLFALLYISVLLAALMVIWVLTEASGSRAASKSKNDRKPRITSVLWKDVGIQALAVVVALAASAALFVGLLTGWKVATEGASAALKLSLLICVGPPAVLVIFGVGGFVYTGLVGRAFFERSREWWSRLNAWFIAVGGAWLVLCLLAFFASPTLQWLAARIGGWIAVLGTGWIGTLLTAIFTPKPEAASSRAHARIDLLLNIAATVFVAGLLVVVAAGTSAGLFAAAGVEVKSVPDRASAPSTTFDLRAAGDRVEYQVSVDQPPQPRYMDFVHAHMDALVQLRSASGLVGISAPWTAWFGLLGVLLLFGWRVDVNKFSLHNMYKNRLVRCYLGASNQATRNAQPFTGLDDQDDFSLRDLDGQRPFHIINTALNISQGSNLAWQERKAASFVLTPDKCGYLLARTQSDPTKIGSVVAPQSRRTSEYAARDLEERGFTLGMAMATSGAAVSPNMGYATQPALAFVLTLFNVRLGRWSPNPAGAKWDRPSPRFGLICLLQELLGYSNEKRNFVYLSDGGHFENLALYELVRKRCKVIFVVDAAADPKRTFGDLANAIRKCRVDFGVEISFPRLDLLRGDETLRAEQGFVEGKIQYDPGDPKMNGKIVLIKPTLRQVQDEPADVLKYAAKNPSFPQQSTADQFFDESQFESYRRLGLSIGEKCLEAHKDLLPHHPLPDADRPPTKAAVETPVFATKWINRLFFRRPAETLTQQHRKGSLVDFFAISLLASVVFGLVVFPAFDRFALTGSAGPWCFSRAACEASVQALLAIGGTARETFYEPLLWRTTLDNFFVVFYTGTFVMGFVVAVWQRAGDRRGRTAKVLLAALCALALLTALVDYLENFHILAWLGTGIPPQQAAEQIALVTALKFLFFTASFAALVALAYQIVRAFRRRWWPSPRDGTVGQVSGT